MKSFRFTCGELNYFFAIGSMIGKLSIQEFMLVAKPMATTLAEWIVNGVMNRNIFLATIRSPNEQSEAERVLD